MVPIEFFCPVSALARGSAHELGIIGPSFSEFRPFPVGIVGFPYLFPVVDAILKYSFAFFQFVRFYEGSNGIRDKIDVDTLIEKLV